MGRPIACRAPEQDERQADVAVDAWPSRRTLGHALRVARHARQEQRRCIDDGALAESGTRCGQLALTIGASRDSCHARCTDLAQLGAADEIAAPRSRRVRA